MSENDNNNDNEARRIMTIHLEQLNERSRWYSNRLWQEPLSYFVIMALALARLSNENRVVIGLACVAFFFFGIIMLYHMSILALRERDAVKALKDLEIKLGLTQRASTDNSFLNSIKVPMFVAVGASTVSIGYLVHILLFEEITFPSDVVEPATSLLIF